MGSLCSINPTDPEYDGDDRIKGTEDPSTYNNTKSYCERQFGYRILVKGNKWDYPNEGRAIMSYAEAPSPRGWDYYEKRHLNSHPLLQC
jgi:hypothetical protein